MSGTGGGTAVGVPVFAGSYAIAANGCATDAHAIHEGGQLWQERFGDTAPNPPEIEIRLKPRPAKPKSEPVAAKPEPQPIPEAPPPGTTVVRKSPSGTTTTTRRRLAPGEKLPETKTTITHTTHESGNVTTTTTRTKPAPAQTTAEVNPEAVATRQHHSNPEFLGGPKKQPLTTMTKDAHDELHRDLNKFLRDRVNPQGDHMRPQKGNPGDIIQQNFTESERLQAMADFYRQFRFKYPDSARDFFAQHPNLK